MSREGERGVSANVDKQRSPLLLQKLDAAMSVGVCIGILIGIAAGILYVSTRESEVRGVIYSITGSLFWANWYVFLGGVFGIIVFLFIFEMSISGKFDFYLQSDKIKTLRQIYENPESTKTHHFLIISCAILFVVFSLSFGLLVGLGALKAFILR